MRLSRGPILSWIFAVCSLAFCMLAPRPGQATVDDVLTQHNDAARTGLQSHETILKPSTVSPTTFGRLYERTVNGQMIAQPLYAGKLATGSGVKNVVYVATRKNWVYAFDADDLSPDPARPPIWSRHLQPDGPVPGMCPETRGSVGISSTPTIDRASGTMYAVARKSDGSWWLHALDIATGLPKAGTPGAVQVPTMAGGFNQSLELNRAGLVLQNGAVYIAFSALNCDNAGWHGWVLAYRASDLVQIGGFLTSPSNASPGAGIWQSGNGLVGDGTYVYFETGNRSWGTPAGATLDESFVKLRLGPAPTYGLTASGHYTVTNRETLNDGDTDLGSGGPVLLPGNRLVGGGKQGKLYVLDTGTMLASQNPPGAPIAGGSDGFQAFFNTWHNDLTQVVCDAESLLQRNCYVPPVRYEQGELFGPNIHTGPVYWNAANPTYGLLYGMPEKDYLRAFKYDKMTKHLATTPTAVSVTRSPDGMPGASLSISANGSSDGIIWAAMPKRDGQWEIGPGRLVAFDALSLKELWRDDDDIAFAKFNPPTVGGGKVFRPTFANKLIVYGLKSGTNSPPCYNITQKYQNLAGPDGFVGAATGPETVAPDGTGHYRHFQGDQVEGFEGASIYWTQTTCAWEVHGAIRGLWAALGWEKSLLGYPLTDESMPPDGIGRYNHFQYGSIYWTPLTGAHEVHGLIRDRWASLGWERSALGYPVTDETDEIDGSGRFNVFEHGTIHWNRATNAITVYTTAGSLNGPGQGGTNRMGADIDNFTLPQSNPAMCQQRCADNSACHAWTYVNPGLQGPQAHCWLKGSVPLLQASGCCTSGLFIEVQPATMSHMDGASDRPGSDLRGFALPDADPRLCQGECAHNAACRAWAYVRPSVQGPSAQCWLKSTSAIVPVANPDVVSGIKQ